MFAAFVDHNHFPPEEAMRMAGRLTFAFTVSVGKVGRAFVHELCAARDRPGVMCPGEGGSLVD